MLVNGKRDSSISIRDRGLLYGDGVFRTMRVLHGHALHWPLHYQKLLHDCTVLGIVCPGIDLLSDELGSLIKQHADGVVKLIVTRGPGVRGYAPLAQDSATRIWDVSPFPDYPEDRATHGIKMQLCELRLSQQPRFAGIKHLNRLENVLAAAELADGDVAEGLLMDAYGNVIEGIRSNIFFVSDGKLITPDLTRCGVAGIQRDRVMAWAASHGMPLHVRDVKLDEVMNAEEVFVVNSIIGLWPVRELAQCRWTDFPVASRIRLYLDGQDIQ